GDQQENLLIRISTALDALGLTVMAIKDGPGPLVIKAVNKAEHGESAPNTARVEQPQRNTQMLRKETLSPIDLMDTHANLFHHAGIEKAAFFLHEHDTLTPKEILYAFTEQFGAALDPQELVMSLSVLFNSMPQDFDEVFNGRCTVFMARLNALRQSKHLIP
ncbi:MAG: hypothetical protein LBF75_08170, partial [Treponema sp.]|nr:hypothetical protein [Treponema sp.]